MKKINYRIVQALGILFILIGYIFLLIKSYEINNEIEIKTLELSKIQIQKNKLKNDLKQNEIKLSETQTELAEIQSILNFKKTLIDEIDKKVKASGNQNLIGIVENDIIIDKKIEKSISSKVNINNISDLINYPLEGKNSGIIRSLGNDLNDLLEKKVELLKQLQTSLYDGNPDKYRHQRLEFIYLQNQINLKLTELLKYKDSFDNLKWVETALKENPTSLFL